MDIHPYSRWIKILMKYKNMEPIKILKNDYYLFVNNLCKQIGWPNIDDISKSTLTTIKPLNYIELLHINACKLRITEPSIFIDMNLWFPPNDLMKRSFASNFIHPVISFQDRKLFHKDYQRVIFYTVHYIINNFLAGILDGSNQVVDIPFSATEEEKDKFSEYAEEFFERAFGIRFEVKIN